jgi:hypothetical protein
MKKKSLFFKRPSDYYDIMMGYYPGMTRKQAKILIFAVDTVISFAIVYRIIVKIGTRLKEDFLLVPRSTMWDFLTKLRESPITVLGENLDSSKLEKLYRDVKRSKK